MLFNSKPGTVDLEDVTGGGSPGSTVDLECTDAKDAKEAEPSTAQTRLPGGRRAAGVLTVSVAILILLPLLELDPKYPDASKGLSVLLVTAMFWVSEVMPLSVSSLLPMALYPLFGIVKASSLAHYFFGGTSFLFIAGFFLGLAIERWNLHTRFVHLMLSKVGGRVEFYLAAFMLCTWLLSMWISNTATILCILPMVKSFQESIDSKHSCFQSGLLLATGYAATIGGLATPVGTPTNGIFMTLFQDFWPEQEEISFATFCVVALPLSAALLVAAYLMACTAFVWAKPEKVVIDADAFLQRQRMGKVSFEEMVVLADLICLMILWLTASRIDRFPGWKHSLDLKQLNSGSIGLLLTLPLFVLPCGRWLPSALKRCLGEDRCQSICKGQPPNYILDWNSVKQDFGWEILFVFGGGSLIAQGTVASGLADLIAQSLETLGLSDFLFILLVSTVVAFVTEFVSNMSTLNIFGSIIVTAAYHMGYNQVQLLLAVSFAASFAFMLPTAGGPNMVVYSSGRIPIGQMARFGFGVNIAAILLGSLYIYYILPVLLTSTGTSYSGLAPPSAQS